MRILWVKAGKLLPVDTGGRIRSYNMLRQLVTRHEVTLLSYYGGQRDNGYESAIREHFPGTVTIWTGAPDTTLLERCIDYLRHLPARAPYAVTKFTSKEVQRTLALRLRGGQHDVAICDFLAPSLNFPAQTSTATVLFQHNVESLLWQRQARHEANGIKRLAFRFEAARMLCYERRMVQRFDHIVAVSDYDREQMKTMVDPARISVVPTGVDWRHYSDAAGPSAAEPLVMFIGSMDWEANIDGINYFCREIWPDIKASVPEARLRIVGRQPHPLVTRLASSTIEVTGSVPSVTPHLREAAVVIVPLRIGGGTRLKIYEAMAMRKAVVSTSIGAEGLDVEHGNDILLADTAGLFASQVIALLRDGDRRARMENLASRTAARYDWSVISEQFEKVLTRLIGAPGNARGVDLEAVPARA
jgi:glycosyltransferase involved in cell wall biosynthesis